MISDSSLWWLHAGAATAHLAQFAYGEGLANSVFKDKGFFKVDNPVFGRTDLTVGKYQLLQLAPLFSLCSAANHLWSVFDFQRYLTYVEAGYNPVRWAEYSVSASLMNVLVGQLSGIQDIKTITALVGGNIALQYIGYSAEKDTALSLHQRNQFIYESAMRQQVAGFLVFAVYMAAILTGFFTAVSSSKNSPPDFVWSIIIIITILYLSFGVLSLLYTRSANRNGSIPRWSPSSFRQVEAGYVVLSLVAKTFLMNMVLFGSIRGEETTPTPTPSSVKT